MHYYYSIEAQDETKIFKYTNPDNTDLNEYWKTTTNSREKTLTTESFDSEFLMYNKFHERISDSEAELLEYTDYEYTGGYSTQEIKSNVINNIVYSASIDTLYFYEVDYINRFGKFNFKKERKFVKYLDLNVLGKRYKTAKFKDYYTIIHVSQGERYYYTQHTYYAKELGMVKYERNLPTGEIRILELADILTEDEFNQLIK